MDKCLLTPPKAADLLSKITHFWPPKAAICSYLLTLGWWMSKYLLTPPKAGPDLLTCQNKINNTGLGVKHRRVALRCGFDVRELGYWCQCIPNKLHPIVISGHNITDHDAGNNYNYNSGTGNIILNPHDVFLIIILPTTTPKGWEICWSNLLEVRGWSNLLKVNIAMRLTHWARQKIH